MNIADIHQAGKRVGIRLNNLSSTFQRKNLEAMFAKIPRDVLIVTVLLFSCATSFGLGVLMGKQLGQGGVIIETLPMSATATVQNAHTSKPDISFHGQVVASKNGSKYYLTSCAGAKRLSPSHKIWFATVAKARAHGYTPAARCKGL